MPIPSPRYRLDRMGLIIAAGVMVLALALTPAEGEIGGRIRLVYAHGAGIWVSLALFVLASGIALVSIARPSLLPFAAAIDLVATALWLCSFILAIISMKVVWGGVFFGEPRMLTSLKVLSLSIAVNALGTLTRNPLARFVLVTGRTVAAFAWIVSTELVLHPDRPVLRSEAGMKLAFAGVLLSLFCLAVLAALSVRRHMH